MIHFSQIYNGDEMKRSDRLYLRYYRTIIRARQLNQQIYGDSCGKSKLELKIQHPLRVAALTEQILNQRISDYHMSWLVGLLHDTKEDGLIIYSERIEEVLRDLLPEQSKQVMQYIDQLSSDEFMTKGEQKRSQILKMEKMELIPSWIRIFDKYDNCRRFLKDSVGKSPAEINGYCAIAFLCYHRAFLRFEQIRKNIQPELKKFYEQIQVRLGGLEKIRVIAEEYIARFN